MSDRNAPGAASATPGAQDGTAPQMDWTRIEGSEEFRELTRRRHRFIAIAAGISFGAFAIYLALAVYATDFMGTLVAGVPIAWPAAMTQVFITWAVTWTYLRKADREFAPLEQRVVERAEQRFVRTEEPTTATERAETAAENRPAAERSAR
jgi:uncharacterized membrane protein (DUF485 family)